MRAVETPLPDGVRGLLCTRDIDDSHVGEVLEGCLPVGREASRRIGKVEIVEQEEDGELSVDAIEQIEHTPVVRRLFLGREVGAAGQLQPPSAIRSGLPLASAKRW